MSVLSESVGTKIVRWLYHARLDVDDHGDPYAPASLAREGFVHCSYAPLVMASVRLYFDTDAPLAVLQIDPRLLAAQIEVAETPRGPMPHVMGAIRRRAIVKVWSRDELDELPDVIGLR